MSRQAFETRSSKTSREAAPSSTSVRNSAIPRQASPGAAKAITHEMIAKRAYEISQSPQNRGEYENWINAERELKGR